MNFLGHAMVARWERDRSVYAFGAMLPDFSRMCGAKLTDVTDPEVAAGVACHHRVDAAFHAAPTFLRLCAEARDTLRAAGLPRPTVLAAAHVGTELVLDGCLVVRPGVLHGYLDAMHSGRARLSALHFAEPEGAERFERLSRHIAEPRAPQGYTDDAEIADRVARILARHPRLSPGGDPRPGLLCFAAAMRPRIADAVPTLLDELRSAL